MGNSRIRKNPYLVASVRKSLSNFSPGESFEYVARTHCTTYFTRGSSQNFAVSPPESAAMTLASEGRSELALASGDNDNDGELLWAQKVLPFYSRV